MSQIWLSATSTRGFQKKQYKITCVIFTSYEKRWKMKNFSIWWYECTEIKKFKLYHSVFLQELPTIASYMKWDKFKTRPINNKMAMFK